MRNCKKKNIFSALVDDIKKIVDLKVEYYTLTFAEKVSLLIARIVLIGFVTILCLVLLLLFIFLIYSLLMSWIGIEWIVILIEIGIVALIMLLLIVFRETLIIKPFANMVIRIMLKSDDSKESDDDWEEKS